MVANLSDTVRVTIIDEGGEAVSTHRRRPSQKLQQIKSGSYVRSKGLAKSN